MNERASIIVTALVMSSACGGIEPVESLVLPSSALCEARFADPEGWSGGDPTGSWQYRSSCNRPVLEWLHSTCPAGSFEMHPGVVTGELTVTSTRIDGYFTHDGEAPVTVDLHEACIRTIGTCPRSHARQPLVCEGDFETECHCRIAPFEVGANFSSAITIADSDISLDFAPDFHGSFRADSRYLHLQDLSQDVDDRFPTKPYFYILERALR